jgi:hypothetical protein
MKKDKKQSAFDFKRISYYRSICDSVELKYEKGALTDVKVNPEDQAAFEGVRHHIELFEADLNTSYFQKLTRTERSLIDLKSSNTNHLLAVMMPIILGLLSVNAFMSIVNWKITEGILYCIGFQLIITFLVYRNGKR